MKRLRIFATNLFFLFRRSYWLLDIVYSIALIIIICSGLTYFIFSGQTHRKISTFVEHQILTFVLETLPAPKTPIESKDTSIITILGKEASDTKDPIPQIVQEILHLNTTPKTRDKTKYFLDFSGFTTTEIRRIFANLKPVNFAANRLKHIFFFLSTSSYLELKKQISDRYQILEVQYCSATKQIVCPYYPNLKNWNIQKLADLFWASERRSLLGFDTLAENLGTNNASYILNIPYLKNSYLQQNEFLLDQISSLSAGKKAVFIGFDRKVESRASSISIPHIPDPKAKFDRLQFWGGLAEHFINNSTPLVANNTLVWTLGIISILVNCYFTIRKGFSIGLYIFGLLVTVIPLVTIAVFGFFNIYIPLFRLLYVIFATFLGLGFFAAASESMFSWIQTTKQNLLNETSDIKENFISLISHNLNTPVAKAIGVLDVLTKFPLGEKANGSMKRAFKTASEIQVAVRNTLCHAKLEEQATFRESISLQNFLKQISEQVLPTCERLGFELTITFSGLSVDQIEEELLNCPVKVNSKVLPQLLFSLTFLLLFERQEQNSPQEINWNFDFQDKELLGDLKIGITLNSSNKDLSFETSHFQLDPLLHSTANRLVQACMDSGLYGFHRKSNKIVLSPSVNPIEKSQNEMLLNIAKVEY